MSSSRHRRDSDPRGDSYYDDYQRRNSYPGNGYGDVGYGGDYDRDGYRSRGHDDKPRSNERRHRSPDDRAVRRLSHHDRRGDGHRDKDESGSRRAIDKVKHSFTGSDEAYVATGVGAVAGALLGSEATKGKKNGPMATILGAVLGGLSANAIDKQYELRKEKRKDEERRWDDKYR